MRGVKIFNASYNQLEEKLALVKTEHQKKDAEISFMNQCATKIQKIARGYLTRKQYDNEIIMFKERAIKVWMNSLQSTSDFCVYSVGVMPEISARKIQKCARKFLFLQKIKRLKKVYETMLEEKLKRIYGIIGTGLMYMKSRMIINGLKFEIYKAARLKEICEKLALLKIKKIYRENKLSFKVIKYRMRKYKRKLKFNQKSPNKSRDPSIDDKIAQQIVTVIEDHELTKVPSVASSFISTPKDGLLGETMLSSQGNIEFFDEINQEVDEIADESSEDDSVIQRRKEKERKEKIKKGFISYKIPKSKPQQNLLPFLYQKDLMESTRPITHHFMSTRATVTRMSESVPLRYVPKKEPPLKLPKTLETRYSSPKNAKRSDSRSKSPSYLRATMSYNLSRWDADMIYPKTEAEVHKKTASGDNKINSPTFTHTQKTQQPYKPQHFDNRPVWRPSTHDNRKHYVVLPLSQTFNKPKKIHRPATNEAPIVNRTQSALNSISEDVPSGQNPGSLSFQAALPEFTQILNHYSSPFYVRLKPQTYKVKGFTKQ
ncbi:unnamed protein product [Blepharisma stoltei]|uniref:Uncharacterized protein n=1 Tax=Blepharisma stoltei TaxID=1481888 RepID=A0AAU9JF25_9CILI|nr:unnamed protein product [Blepharisma stoltei]